MFETNTASCGGFPGLSDSFGSALWMLDYALQMAYSNFSGAMMHVSGEDVYYIVTARGAGPRLVLATCQNYFVYIVKCVTATEEEKVIYSTYVVMNKLR
jgi:hypothetical protein